MKASREYGRGATSVGHGSHRFLLTKRTQGTRTATRFAVGRAATAWKLALVVAGALALAIAASGGASAAAAAAPLSANVTVFASGLNNPRGLAFGPGGDLFVA